MVIKRDIPSQCCLKRYQLAFSICQTDRPDHSRRNDNFPFDQNSPARSVKSQIVCLKEMVFQQKPSDKAYYLFKLIGRAMVRRGGSDKWKAP